MLGAVVVAAAVGNTCYCDNENFDNLCKYSSVQGYEHCDDVVFTGSLLNTDVVGVYCFWNSFTATNFSGSLETNLFEECTQLQWVSFPELRGDIGSYAFKGCSGLVNVSFPQMKGNIDNSAFENCALLETASFPEMSGNINKNSFYGCSSLTTASFPSMSGRIYPHAFSHCDMLETLETPRVSELEGILCDNCEKLTTVCFPNVTGLYIDPEAQHEGLPLNNLQINPPYHTVYMPLMLGQSSYYDTIYELCLENTDPFSGNRFIENCAEVDHVPFSCGGSTASTTSFSSSTSVAHTTTTTISASTTHSSLSLSYSTTVSSGTTARRQQAAKDDSDVALTAAVVVACIVIAVFGVMVLSKNIHGYRKILLP